MEMPSKSHKETSEAKKSTKNSGLRETFRDIGHLVRAQWPKYLIDILVIIIGITISFTLDSRKEEANRAVLENKYSKGLLEDIDSDITKLGDLIIKTKQIVSSANALLVLTNQQDQAPIDLEKFSSNFSKMLATPKFISKDATFLDLRSGNIQLITDFRIRATLFEYYGLYETIKADETLERDQLVNLVQPYLLKTFSAKAFIISKKLIVPKGTDLRIVLQENGFSNSVGMRLIVRQDLLIRYQEQLRQAEKFKATLEKLIQY